MNRAYVFCPTGVEIKLPKEPPAGTAIKVDDETFDLVMLTATYLGAVAEFNIKAHEALTSMAEAEPVPIETVDFHAVKSGGVEPIVVTLSVASAAQHAIRIMNGLMDMHEEAN